MADLTITKMSPSIVGDDICITIWVEDSRRRPVRASVVVDGAPPEELASRLISIAKQALLS